MYDRVSCDVVCKRFNFHVVDSEVRDAAGWTFSRSWAWHPPTVATVAVTEQLEVPLIRQYRVAVDGYNLELPGGRMDDQDASFVDAAARELEEEAGFRPSSIEPLGSFLNSPGHCSQESHLFLALELTRVARTLDADEESTSSVELIGLSEVDVLIGEGHVRDAKTIIGLLRVARRLGL